MSQQSSITADKSGKASDSLREDPAHPGTSADFPGHLLIGFQGASVFLSVHWVLPAWPLTSDAGVFSLAALSSWRACPELPTAVCPAPSAVLRHVTSPLYSLQAKSLVLL